MIWQHFNSVPCFRSWERRSDSRGHRRHERVLDERIEGGFGSHALLLDEGLVHPLRGRGKSPKRRGQVQVENSELKSCRKNISLYTGSLLFVALNHNHSPSSTVPNVTVHVNVVADQFSSDDGSTCHAHIDLLCADYREPKLDRWKKVI